MKTILFLFVLFGFSLQIQAQMRLLTDKSIVAHEKRMVFQQWGEFRPYPRYFLGIQTNFAYACVWGWLAPSRNRRYKRGADIRPLDADGLETQRYAGLVIQKNKAEYIKNSVDSIHQKAKDDFAHWTNLTVDSDPLWLLYYKRMLRDVNEFPAEPQNYQEWGLASEAIYQNLINTGNIKLLQQQLDIIKDKYHISRTLAMPRGKRFLMYHETLIAWRNFTMHLNRMNKTSKRLVEYGTKVHQLNNYKDNFQQYNSDIEIVTDVMSHYLNQF